MDRSSFLSSSGMRSTAPQFRRADQHALAIGLFLERQDVILDALEGDGGHRRRHLVPRDLRFDDFQQCVQAFAGQGAGADVAAADAVALAELLQPLLGERGRAAITRRPPARRAAVVPCP